MYFPKCWAVPPLRLLSSGASSSNILSKSKSSKSAVVNEFVRMKKRYFDGHTISIWAKNIVQRGGSADTAIRMILGRMEMGKLPHTTALYNTALDVCGHRGMLLEAARILHQMVGRNVRADERTISSLLNAIAEYSINLPNTLADSKEQNSTADAKNESSELPGLEAFKVSSKEAAAELAIKLYTSWLKVSSPPSTPPFNNLLKVLCVTKSKELLKSAFPVSGRAEWIPKQLDKISFTMAMAAAGDDFALAQSYWDAFCEQRLKGKGNNVAPDALMIKTIAWSLLNDLSSKGKVPKDVDLQAKREFVKGLLDPLKKATPFMADAGSNFLHLTVRLGLYPLGIKYWTETLLPILQQNGSFVKSKEYINQQTVIAVAELYIMSKQPSEAILFVEELRRRYGMHIDTPLVNVMLVAHRKLGDAVGAEKLFNRYFHAQGECKSKSKGSQPLRPDHKIMRNLLLIILEDKASTLGVRSQRIASYKQWLQNQYPEVYEKTIRLSKRLDLKTT